ncbi:MAG: MBL fold metallo-hydrolase [Actinomycetota bacterium]
MFLDALSDNPYGTNCWIVSADGTDDAVVVDPGFFADRIWVSLREAGKTPVAALATHGHFDHIGAAAEFCGDDLPLYIHEADAQALTDPAAWGAGFETPPVPVKDVRTIVDGDALRFAGFSFEVAHTPGHTPGSVCYRADGFVFAGDLVFAGSIGRSDLPNSDPAAMQASLLRFLTWPDEQDVYPGHGPDTTIARERATNPFLAGA